MTSKWIALAVVLGCACAHAAPPKVPHTRTEDVIYARRDGMALTMDVFTPTRNANGVGVIILISLGWGSNRGAIEMFSIDDLLAPGYTVFAVIHGSKPKYTIPEAIDDVHRAVQYIRHHAKEYNVDPERIGVTGASSGGHLALMLGTADHKGKPDPRDASSRVSSRVQAVACFFPPTDFLNYEKPGQDAIGRGILEYYRPCFDFHEFSRTENAFMRITDEKRIKELGRQISPITHVSSDDAPTLIIHGDADMMVPIQQAETFLAKLKEAGVATKLVVKRGAQHAFDGWQQEMPTIAEWFDEHLRAQTGKP